MKPKQKTPDRLIGHCYSGKTVTFRFNGKQYIVMTEDMPAIKELWAALFPETEIDETKIKTASLLPFSPFAE